MVLVVLFAGALGVACVVLALLIAAQGTPQGSPPKVAPPPPGIAPTAQKLPPSCAMTGDVYGNNAIVKGGIERKGVRATYHFYSPHYTTSSLACANMVHTFKKQLLQYPWTAYCLDGSAKWDPRRTCGKCLRVRNRSTGAAIIVRAVDSGGCSGPGANGLDLDPCAFNAIDTNKHGVRDGHMMLDVEEVRC